MSLAARASDEPAAARQAAGPSGAWASSATSSASSPRRSTGSAAPRPSATGTGPPRICSISRIVSSTRFRAVTSSSSRSRSTALATYPAYSEARSRSSRRGGPAVARNTVITPSSPPGPSTGTDHELATLADRASSVNGPQVGPACTFSSTTGAWLLAASPTGPPAGPHGSRDHACSNCGARPSDAAQTSDPSASKWMHSRSLPSAAPSADRISDRLLDGSADTSRPVSPCSRISCRRAEESTSCPDTSATTSSGCTSLGDTSAMTRPCRSTTMRSASRNICAVSWQASSTVVPCSRTRMIRSSTSPDSCTPREAVGSSSSSSRGWCTMARATATIWRCPPDSDRTDRSGSCSGTPSRSKMRAASVRNRMSDSS